MRQVSCGSDHSCFLTEQGDVYACGEGEKGQLGLGYISMKEYRPLKLKFKYLKKNDYIAQVSCGSYHTLFLTDKQEVFATGLNDFG